MKRRADLAFSAAILVIAAAMVWQAKDWPARSQLFPLTIGIPTVVLSLVQVVVAFRRCRAELRVAPAAVAMTSEEVAIPARVVRQRLIETCVWILVFAGGIIVLGFTLAAPILVVAFLRIAAREPWRVTLPLALGVYVAFFFGFGRILHVPFPAGVLADTLKLDALDSYLMRPLLQPFQNLPV